MDEAGSDHHTLDDLFQKLCVRNIPPVQARRQILQACQDEKLKIDFHIRGGSRKTAPSRLATDEELKARRQKRATLDHLYEVAPPEGITGRVHYQSWERVFTLSIKGGQLVVEPRDKLDYPWDAYSFTIANWSVINELWPPLVMTFAPPAASVAAASPAAPAVKTSPAVSAAEAPASETASLPKMSRLKWIEGYLTKKRKEALGSEYKGVVKAAEGVLKDMKNDSRVEPYKNARALEPYLTGIFPKRRPRKNLPGSTSRLNSQRS